MTGPPTPPGDLYGCETKGVAGKAIRKNMKTKGEPIGFATNAGKPEARRGYTSLCGNRIFVVAEPNILWSAKYRDSIYGRTNQLPHILVHPRGDRKNAQSSDATAH